jgi:hypothetical protein
MTAILTAGAMRLAPQWPTLKLNAACPFRPSAPEFSFRLQRDGDPSLLRQQDFEPAAMEQALLTEGLFRNFGQWTMSGRRDGLEMRLHTLAYPGEPSVILEPEIINHGATSCALTDIRVHLRLANDPNLTAHLVCGRPEYVIKRDGVPYVMPYDSRTWRGSLSELRDRPPECNCGHLVVTDGARAMACWSALGHETNCGGRSQYAILPFDVLIEEGSVEISFPLYLAGVGPVPTHAIPLAPGQACRLFGVVFTVGPITDGDPWSVVRDARAAALRRAPAVAGTPPPVAGGSWNWSKWKDQNLTELERREFAIRPPTRPQHPETPHHEATGHESYIRPQIPHWRDLGCELGWIDMTPIATGTYAPVGSNFPSGLDACRAELRAAGLGASFILNPDSLENPAVHHSEWTDELERRFGDCRHSKPGGNTLCLASRWGEHAAAEFARVVREYDLCLVQVAFNHNQPAALGNCCTHAAHGHAPAGADASDYVRGYLAAHNRIYAAIRAARPGTLVLENLPTVYDLGNPCPDAMWTADTLHQPQLVSLLLDYIAGQRRLWPMEMRFAHYMSMNLEPEGESTFLVANIALGHIIALGDDFRHIPPGLRAFCKKWIAFYRAHRQWLCADLRLLAPGVIGHRLPGEFMVFAFNGEDRERPVEIRFTSTTAGLPTTTLQVVAEHADRQQQLGETRPTDGAFIWTAPVAAFGFTVLRFRAEDEGACSTTSAKVNV